jgi:3-methyladenine DNA glycosylase AlkD
VSEKMNAVFGQLATAMKPAMDAMDRFSASMTELPGFREATDLWCCRAYVRLAARKIASDSCVLDVEESVCREDAAVLAAIRSAAAKLSLTEVAVLAGKSYADEMEEVDCVRRAEASPLFSAVVPRHVLVWGVMSS